MMEVDGENHDEGLERNYQRRPHTQRSRVEAIEWTLEHHKQFVDTMNRLCLGDLTVRTPRRTILIVELMNNEAFRLIPRSTLLRHIKLFERFQSCQKASSHSDLMRDFERLNINKEEDLSFSWTPKYLSFSWTPVYHEDLVEAVIQLGGLGKATAKGILKLLEHHRDLTVQAVSYHLSGLKNLQKMTRTFQEKIH
ncbi:unnamed protein product [Prunus armeniaca]|uniref:Uncharacterized protein n=1 Tax=Prunus armeniaca TaxID=36596 RepID=A0A6J5WN78_PRUAR|nr:hypothetical protein GBA52_006963 [Prunus armeniaca]CAB4270723.1 unnamed protein product [Prunus armeniaca]CAB4301102.1 unnamed protein product [Prunus armeniaca]